MEKEETPEDIAPAATLRASALRNSLEDSRRGGSLIDRQDLRLRIRRPPVDALILIILDTSDSMGAEKRIQAAKKSVFGLLKIAHRKRYRVGLISAQGKEAREIVPPGSSIYRVHKKLSALRPEGGTPLASALRKAVRSIHNEKLKHPGIFPLLLLISDGEATVPIGHIADPHLELVETAEKIRRREKPAAICIDTKERPPGAVGQSEMRELSEVLNARYYLREDIYARR